ncbi:hypothetical protein V9T40_014698 [Parthenolecanium corni]|uniref:Uncharacterized protein n=1 Tax=Parthenolecanium corni TaxID=536013 RepID=A0AAN9T4E0_9HEMI
MYDKLREQQNEELEAMENYLGQIREMSEKQTVDIENENKKMQDQLAHILSVISNIFNDEDAGNSITDKIDQFCSKYIKLTEEVQVLNKLKLNNPHSDDMIAEMITISTEKETLKREVAELNERMQLLQKSSRELELDNEKLAFKLSEAFAELEEKEIRSNREIFIYSFSSDSNKSTLSRLDSEPINQTDKILSQGCRTESTSPSLILNDMTDYKSSSKLSSLMNSCHEMARLEENKKLQTECESMKSRISNLGEKYNNLALKYIQLKAKKKFQVEDLRARLDASLCQIETLQVQLSVQRQRLRAEEIFRKQIESDLRKLQDEKRNIMVRLMNSDMELKENNRELVILQKKIAMLDSTNSDLLAQLLRSKYKEPTVHINDDLESPCI